MLLDWQGSFAQCPTSFVVAGTLQAMVVVTPSDQSRRTHRSLPAHSKVPAAASQTYQADTSCTCVMARFDPGPAGVMERRGKFLILIMDHSGRRSGTVGKQTSVQSVHRIRGPLSEVLIGFHFSTDGPQANVHPHGEWTPRTQS